MPEELKDKLDDQETVEEKRQRLDREYSDLVQEESEHDDCER